MSDAPALSHKLRFADLPARKSSHVTLTPDAKTCETLAAELGIAAIRKMRFEVTLKPLGRRDWALEGKLGATVVQSCVVTLQPVSTRIEESVSRQYVEDYEAAPEASEIEMPEDDTVEPLPAVIDLGLVASEALALALPLYPRSEGAALEETAFTEPGKETLTDDDVKPFAGLASLRDKLENGSD